MRGPSTLGFPFQILAMLLAIVCLAGPAQAGGPGKGSFVDASPIIAVKFGCKLVDGKLVCGKGQDGGGGHNGDDKKQENKSKDKDKSGGSDNGGDKKNKNKKKEKDKSKDKSGGSVERACPPGYVVLDKPNKYGAFCEPKEGLPKTPAEQEAEKCKFGMIGTPPNDCHCPNGTEFLGNKGCVKFTREQYCNKIDSTGLESFASTCKTKYYGTPSCATLNTDPPHGSYNCCCYYKIFAE